MIVSRVSAIDLAGSEDNRRTDNEKERLVESSSINKSLFVLAQCVEAITKSRPRVPYRESKMTRILSLGQNNGLTIMILNLAPVRSYHLDTLSSLNFANRTKKIEIRDVENEPILRYLGKVAPSSSSVSGTSFHRQPLRPIPAAANIGLSVLTSTKHKKARSFSVFIEHEKPDKPVDRQRRDQSIREANNSHFVPGESNDNQDPGNTHVVETAAISAKLEEIIDRMVDEKLAKRVRAEPDSQSTRCLSDELRQRLEALEQRVDHKENHRAEGLQYLLMAKQHQCHGEDASALKMYQLALPYFPDNEKLAHKLLNLQSKISQKKPVDMQTPKSLATSYHERQTVSQLPLKLNRITSSKDDCENHAVGPKIDHDELDEDDNYRAEPAPRKAVKRLKLRAFHDTPMELDDNLGSGPDSSSPRTLHLLRIINSRDVTQIRLLKGVGAKKAEVIVNCLCGEAWESEEQPGTTITTLAELSALKGVGLKTVENMRAGIAIP